MQRPKKVPLRKCAGCQEQSPKRELIRVVHTPEGEVRLDLTGRQNGRGVYLCKKLDCLKAARKRKSLEKSLKTPIPDTVYEELERTLERAVPSSEVR
jgi:predicted RNA-binding protein YlxR (DUF448 family)